MQLDRELERCLRAALKAGESPWADVRLEVLRDKGLAHNHVRLSGSGILARIPKQSQLGLNAQANLLYQRACFERAQASGHTPKFMGWLQTSTHLPHGALLVEEIIGRPAVLPGDLDAIARSLASLHALALPRATDREALLNADDPLRALAGEIDDQALHLQAAGIASASAAAIEREMAGLRMACKSSVRPQRHLIAFDGHPGNFIINAAGDAMLVDLEKCRYSYPGLDLAHATLYTSTTWDLDCCATLDLDQVLGFYAAWAAAVGPAAADARSWHVPLRRAMWLWSVTWCAKWRALSGRAASASADGEDWSAERSGAALVAHVRGRVDHYLSAPVVAQVLAEFDALDWALGA